MARDRPSNLTITAIGSNIVRRPLTFTTSKVPLPILANTITFIPDAEETFPPSVMDINECVVRLFDNLLAVLELKHICYTCITMITTDVFDLSTTWLIAIDASDR